MPERFAQMVREIAQTELVVGYHEREGGGVFFEVGCGQGRSQVVMAQLVDEGQGNLMVHMMSEIGPVEPGLCEAMLVRNLGFCYGRVAIVDSGGDRRFAVVYTYPLAELDALEFVRAFGEVAFMADGIERDVYAGADRV